jgi:hypothetical protein
LNLPSHRLNYGAGQVVSAKAQPRGLKRFNFEPLSISVKKEDQSENIDSQRVLAAEPAGSVHPSLSAALLSAGTISAAY